MGRPIGSVTRSTMRDASDHLLAGLLFDDAGYRMVLTHATKASIRYRYYVSSPHLHGESKTAAVGSVSRVPAANIEEVVVKSLNENLVTENGALTPNVAHASDRQMILGRVERIDVCRDRLLVRLKSDHPADLADAASPSDVHNLSIPWQKPPSKRPRQILLPHGVSRNAVRPERAERRARLVAAIARGRRWLAEIVSGSITCVEQIASRESCSIRQVSMTISLAFLAPDLVKAAVEGRLPRGIGVERLREAPEWRQQFEVLGLNPQ
jgi:site-specific DNA recombinase